MEEIPQAETVVAEPVSESVSQTEAPSPEAKQDYFNRRRIPTEGELAGINGRELPDQDTETHPAEQTPEIKPPQSLNAKTRELWSKIPREMQEFISIRERQAHSKITELGRSQKELSELGGVFEQDAVDFLQAIYKSPHFDLGTRMDAAHKASQFERPKKSESSIRDETDYVKRVAVMPAPVKDMAEWLRLNMEEDKQEAPDLEWTKKLARFAKDAEGKTQRGDLDPREAAAKKIQ
jgi:hypothetical protein